MEKEECSFKGYPSIELSTRQNFVERLKQFKHTEPEVVWVASEKIHGCNFSVYCDGDIVKYGRRNDYITKDIPIDSGKIDTFFVESFYSAPKIVSGFHNKLGDLFKSLKEHYPTIKNYTLYGEYFGGNWIEKTESKAKPVQTGIKYTPNHEYLVFDANIQTTDGLSLWVDALDLQEYIGKFIKTVPILAKGKFEDVYGVDIKIDSTIPQVLGFLKVNDNLIEGMVLRPNKTTFIEEDRVMLKKKNAQFLQKAPVDNKKEGGKAKGEKEVPAQLVEPLNTLCAYLNNNRIQSVLSKFPAVKDRNKLKKEVLDDILVDAEKDEFKQPQADTYKRVLAQLDKRIMKSLNDYLSTH